LRSRQCAKLDLYPRPESEAAKQMDEARWARLAEPADRIPARRRMNRVLRNIVTASPIVIVLFGLQAVRVVRNFKSGDGRAEATALAITIPTGVALVVGITLVYSWRANRAILRTKADHAGYVAVGLIIDNRSTWRWGVMVLAPDGIWWVPDWRTTRSRAREVHISLWQVSSIRISRDRRARNIECVVEGDGRVLLSGKIFPMSRERRDIEFAIAQLDTVQ
jgi:hypothetical protein